MRQAPSRTVPWMACGGALSGIWRTAAPSRNRPSRIRPHQGTIGKHPNRSPWRSSSDAADPESPDPAAVARQHGHLRVTRGQRDVFVTHGTTLLGRSRGAAGHAGCARSGPPLGPLCGSDGRSAALAQRPDRHDRRRPRERPPPGRPSAAGARRAHGLRRGHRRVPPARRRVVHLLGTAPDHRPPRMRRLGDGSARRMRRRRGRRTGGGASPPGFGAPARAPGRAPRARAAAASSSASGVVSRSPATRGSKSREASAPGRPPVPPRRPGAPRNGSAAGPRPSSTASAGSSATRPSAEAVPVEHDGGSRPRPPATDSVRASLTEPVPRDSVASPSTAYEPSVPRGHPRSTPVGDGVTADPHLQPPGDRLGAGVLLEPGDRPGDPYGVGQHLPEPLGRNRNEHLMLHVGASLPSMARSAPTHPGILSGPSRRRMLPGPARPAPPPRHPVPGTATAVPRMHQRRRRQPRDPRPLRRPRTRRQRPASRADPRAAAVRAEPQRGLRAAGQDEPQSWGARVRRRPCGRVPP